MQSINACLRKVWLHLLVINSCQIPLQCTYFSVVEAFFLAPKICQRLLFLFKVRCSRVVVLRERRSVAELSGPALSEHTLLRAMAGHHD